MQILIADDSNVFRAALRRTLEAESGFQIVAEATNGEEAVKKTEEFHPDLVIMDISMPGMNGLNAARIIRNDSPHTKLLILSEHGGQFVTEAVKLLGLDGYVTKHKAGQKLVPALQAIGHSASH
jgi:DNA-binding NarL/FixJ family response regulator